MKLVILISLSVLCTLVTGVPFNDGFKEEDTDLEEAFRLLMDNDVEDDMLDEEALADVMLTSWFNKVGSWTKKAVHDAGSWTKQAAHDTGRWTKQAAHDTGKWTKQAAHDAAEGIKKGCKVVRAIPLKDMVLRVKEEMVRRGVQEEDIDEDQALAVASGIYRGTKALCQVI